MSSGAKAAERASTNADAAWTEFATASQRLLARRREQRGTYTYGDACDAALLDALARLRLDAEAGLGVSRLALVSAAGEAVGRSVYARRMFEDSFRGAFIVLSASLVASGVGAVEVRDAFHRTATAAFRPADAAARAAVEVRDAYLCGVMRGFFGEAFNCEARAERARPDVFTVELGEGRDVNRRGP